MNRREITDLINEIEETFPVDTWVVEGIRVWPLIRIPLGLNLYKDSEKFTNLKKIARKVKGDFITLKALIADSQHNTTYKKKADAVFLSNTTCRTKLIGGWYDRICDPFVEELTKIGWVSQVYETTGGYESRIPRYYESTLIQLKLDWINITSLIRMFIHRRSVYELKKWADFVGFCKENRIIRYVPNEQKLFGRVVRIKRLSEFFESILKCNQPRLAFVEWYYGDNGMAFNLACKRLGIPSIDIQHGVQGDFHVGYGRWNNVPWGGYELLPSYFWCWTSHEANSINNWSKKLNGEHIAIVGSNLWLNKWIQGKDTALKPYDAAIRQLIDNKSRNILVTLQPGFDPEPWFYEAVNKLSPETKWFIRLHPGMTTEKGRFRAIFRKLCPDANVEIEQATGLPLLAWLRHVDVHVTQFSTCVIEAEAFGIPSIITHAYGVDMYNDQIQRGTASTAFSAMEIIEKINKLGADRNENVKTVDLSNISTNSFKSKISEIIKNNSLMPKKTYY